VIESARVTAGLTWAPETCPSEPTIATSASPKTKAIASESYEPPAVGLAMAAPTATEVPAKTKMNVPTPSATADRRIPPPILPSAELPRSGARASSSFLRAAEPTPTRARFR